MLGGLDKLDAERGRERKLETMQDYIVLNSGKEEVKRVAAHAFFNLAKHWALSEEEAANLLDISPEDYQVWQGNNVDSLTEESLEKIACLLGMYKHLATLYSGQRSRMGAWMRRANAGNLYNGETPLHILSQAGVDKFYSVLRQLASATV